MNKYCINLDWFEVFTYEPTDCTGPEFYEDLGYVVNVREYGTRVYRQMFTLIDREGHPWIEIRRDPASKKSQGGVLDDKACSIRLVNRTCYDWLPINDLYNFLSNLGFHYRKYELCSISRVDLCVDFLDGSLSVPELGSGTRVPVRCGEFIRRFMGGEWWKIGNARVQAFGEEFSDGMHFHALKFGSPTSMVSTKLYNKTLEMAQVKIKPHIIESWVNAGLLQDENDTAQVWRLEFSINSNCDDWIAEAVMPSEDPYYQQNTLAAFVQTANYSRFLRGLISHYFRFALKEEGKTKYKASRFLPFSLPADCAFRPVHLQPERRTSGRGEKVVINKLMQLKEKLPLAAKFSKAIDTTLWLLNSVYCNHAVSGSEIDDEEVLARQLADYDEATITEAFREIIGNVHYGPHAREVAEMCWGIWNREFIQFARARWAKSPYSITAVRFLDPNAPSVEEKVKIRHLRSWYEWKHRNSLVLDY